MPRKAPDGLRPLKEIAAAINAHLMRFEADRDGVNAVRPSHEGTRPYYSASAFYPGAGKVSVVYVSYQGRTKMPRDEAERYLAWLDAGNVGTHYRIPKDWTPEGGPNDAA